jgi:hypothetical protein
MTWKTLTHLLAREFRHLHRMHVVSFGFANAPVFDSNDLRREESQLRERVNTIVRDFARTRRWPALDEKERFFLRERIRFSYEYAALGEISVYRPLTMVGSTRAGDEQRRILEWFLIDIWEKSGVANWIEPFVSLTRSSTVRSRAWDLQVTE